MPRGFLVKRLQKHSQASSAYRIRRCSDEDRSCDSTSSDHDDELEKNGVDGDSMDDSRRQQLCSLRVSPDPNSLIGGEAATAAALLLAAAYRRHSDLQLLYSASCNERASTVDAASSSEDACPSSDFSRHRLLLQSGACSPILPTNLSLDRLTVSPADRVPHTPPPTTTTTTTTSEKTLSEESSSSSIYRQFQSDKKRSRLLAIGDQASEYGGRIKSPKKSKAVRRLHFDEDKSSPVSGTIIRELDSDEEPLVIRKGDIDPSFNVVEVTDEAKAEIAKIENKIGDYVCQLCKEVYDDAFGLAQHRCSRIVHVEYRCPECDKVFNCPANLASHRRWHKPRPPPSSAKAAAKAAAAAAAAAATADDKVSATAAAASTLLTVSVTTSRDNNNGTSAVVRGTPSPSDASSSSKDAHPLPTFDCEQCGKRFRRQTYLRRHMANHASVAAAAAAPTSTTTTTTTTTTTSIGASIFIYDAMASSATASPSPPSSSASSSASVSPHHPHHHHHHHNHSHHNHHLHQQQQQQQQLLDGAHRRGILSPTPLRQHHGGVLHQLLRTPSHRPTPPHDVNGNQRSNMLLSPHHVALEKLVNSTSPLSSTSSSSNGNPTEEQHAAAGSIMSSPYDCKYVCPPSATAATATRPSSSPPPPPPPIFVPMRRALDSTSGGLYHHHRQATSGLLLQMVHTIEATQ